MKKLLYFTAEDMYSLLWGFLCLMRSLHIWV